MDTGQWASLRKLRGDCAPDWETIDRSPFFAMSDMRVSIFYRGLGAATRRLGRFQAGLNRVLGQKTR